MKLAAYTAALTVVFAVASLLLDAGIPHDEPATIRLEAPLVMDVLLGLALWIAIYVGILLGDRQGGYWTKAKGEGHDRDAVMWCGAAIGVALLFTVAVCHFSQIHPRAPVVAGFGSALAPLFALLAFSLAEEFVYRGCFQALLDSWFGPSRLGGLCAIIIAAVLFAAQHVDPTHPNARFLMAFVAGLAFGAVFSRFGVLAAASAHFGSNLLATFLLPHIF